MRKEMGKAATVPAWVPTVGTDGVRGEMALPAVHPQVVGDQGEVPCCRGERPLWFLPAPAQLQMQVKYKLGQGGMAWNTGSGAKDA